MNKAKINTPVLCFILVTSTAHDCSNGSYKQLNTRDINRDCSNGSYEQLNTLAAKDLGIKSTVLVIDMTIAR